jgi:serine phosphatase RsbU (regulator of sigma subunit)
MEQLPLSSSSAKPPCIDWSVSTRPYDGERECGDAYVVVNIPNGVLMAVIDGLGHGSEAAEASRAAVKTITDNASESVTRLISICHGTLHNTRGAALSIVSIDAASNTLTWAGVGNVEGMLFRADETMAPLRESLPLRSGVVGYQIQAVRANTLPVFAGDVLVMVTDGILTQFTEASLIGGADDIAAGILERYGKDTDDALALVARYIGAQA